jgi:hypothetical protein
MALYDESYSTDTLKYIASLAPIGRFAELTVREIPFTGSLRLWGGRGDGSSLGWVDVRTLVGEVIANAVARAWIVECGQTCRIFSESLVACGGEPSRELAVAYGFEEPDADLRVLRAWDAARRAVDEAGDLKEPTSPPRLDAALADQPIESQTQGPDVPAPQTP